jgi:GNAT superfamily N-acetyltransferase
MKVPELDQVVTHPAHRRKGAAVLLMQWGIDKADQLGLEACIESVPSARPVYERYGFVVTDVIDVDMTVPDPSERWKELQQLELTAFYMWRPKGGKFVEGETAVPWHVRAIDSPQL